MRKTDVAKAAALAATQGHLVRLAYDDTATMEVRNAAAGASTAINKLLAELAKEPKPLVKA